MRLNSGLTDVSKKECNFNRIIHTFCSIKGLPPKKNGHPKRVVVGFCFTRNDFKGDKDYSLDLSCITFCEKLGGDSLNKTF